MQHFKRKNDLKTIQDLIIDLDFQKVGTDEIKNFCMEEILLHFLIYICTIYDEDYATPLAKGFLIYQQKWKQLVEQAKSGKGPILDLKLISELQNLGNT